MSGRCGSTNAIRPSKEDRKEPIDVSEDGRVADDENGENGDTANKDDIDLEVKTGDEEKFRCEPCGLGEGELQKAARSPRRPSPK